ncbi:hypothetical protein AB6A40_004080 [Gnathostoma spinigerum]|uniref:Essential MCU regulator, mitochondrial n=1 Tax=Gnathostoma spinigerum TaxID=75299 RepID=A0ABD6EDS3_9BILA
MSADIERRSLVELVSKWIYSRVKHLYIGKKFVSLTDTRSRQMTQRNIHVPVGSLPYTRRLGVVKVMFVAVASLVVGALIAKKGASLLMENDIFVPADDDDDNE